LLCDVLGFQGQNFVGYVGIYLPTGDALGVVEVWFDSVDAATTVDIGLESELC